MCGAALRGLSLGWQDKFVVFVGKLGIAKRVDMRATILASSLQVRAWNVGKLDREHGDEATRRQDDEDCCNGATARRRDDGEVISGKETMVPVSVAQLHRYILVSSASTRLWTSSRLSPNSSLCSFKDPVQCNFVISHMQCMATEA